jgi:hypothetical protein
MFTTNVSMSPMIAERSGGILRETLRVLIRNSQGFPMICFAILSKQNILASAVPSVS